MNVALLTVKLHSDQSLVALRDRCRQVGELFGLDSLPRTRLVTAVSEIGRNALQYAGGATVTFHFGESSLRASAQSIMVRVADRGAGLPATAWFDGRPAGAGGGIAGSQRLVDAFAIETSNTGGTTVTLEMLLPKGLPLLSAPDVNRRADELVRRRPQSPHEELEHQNREMLFALEELRQRQGELVEADHRKNEFLAMLAHELRNPLAAITLTVDLLKRKASVTPVELEKYRDAIGRQASQLTRLINDLMDVSRISRGKVDLQPEPFAVETLLEHSVEMTQAIVDAKSHRLTVVHAPSPLWLDVDVARMKQVISNLIHNAARYTPSGGSITVSSRRDGNSAEIAVADNGIGIEQAMQTQVFDLFTQASGTLGREDAGLGVGLTVAHRLVTDHGGTIHVESAGLGQGSRFVVRLPLATMPTLAEAAPSAAEATMQSRRLLIIDDNVDASTAIAESLRLSGFRCTVAHDGEAGVLEGLRTRPDVAIVDIGLPKLDGFGVARLLRQQLGSTLRLIAMSGYSSDDIQRQATEAGFDLFLVKPVDMATLMAQL